MIPLLLACEAEKPPAADPPDDAHPVDTHADPGTETAEDSPTDTELPDTDRTDSDSGDPVDTDTGPAWDGPTMESLTSAQFVGGPFAYLGLSYVAVVPTSSDGDSLTVVTDVLGDTPNGALHTWTWSGTRDYLPGQSTGSFQFVNCGTEDDILLLPDSDDDGASELLATTAEAHYEGGSLAAVVFELPLTGVNDWWLAETSFWIDDARYNALAHPVAADIDGDGVTEVGVASWAVAGPEDDPDDPQGGTAFFYRAGQDHLLLSDADAVVGGWSSGAYSTADAYADLNDDGYVDLLAIDPSWECDGTSTQCGRLVVVAGPLTGSAQPEDVAMLTLTGDLEEGHRVVADVLHAGDVDADGDADLGVEVVAFPDDEGFEFQWTWFTMPMSGTATPADGGARVVSEGSWSDEEWWQTGAATDVGDFDGDGAADMIWVDRTDDTLAEDAGLLYLVWGPLSGDRHDFDSTLYGSVADKDPGSALARHDLDDDGADDVLIGAYTDETWGSGTGTVSVILGKDLASLRP